MSYQSHTSPSTTSKKAPVGIVGVALGVTAIVLVLLAMLVLGSAMLLVLGTLVAVVGFVVSVITLVRQVRGKRPFLMPLIGLVLCLLPLLPPVIM